MEDITAYWLSLSYSQSMRLLHELIDKRGGHSSNLNKREAKLYTLATEWYNDSHGG